MDFFIDVVGGMFVGLLQMFSRMDTRTQVTVARNLTGAFHGINRDLRKRDDKGYNNFDSADDAEHEMGNLIDASNKLNETLKKKFNTTMTIASFIGKLKNRKENNLPVAEAVPAPVEEQSWNQKNKVGGKRRSTRKKRRTKKRRRTRRRR